MFGTALICLTLSPLVRKFSDVSPAALLAERLDGALRVRVCGCCDGRARLDSRYSWRHEPPPAESPTANWPRKAYITREVKKRLHQDRFRFLVLDAYREQCAMCRLRQLLRVPDLSSETGDTVVPGSRMQRARMWKATASQWWKWRASS